MIDTRDLGIVVVSRDTDVPHDAHDLEPGSWLPIGTPELSLEVREAQTTADRIVPTEHALHEHVVHDDEPPRAVSVR